MPGLSTRAVLRRLIAAARRAPVACIVDGDQVCMTYLPAHFLVLNQQRPCIGSAARQQGRNLDGGQYQRGIRPLEQRLNLRRKALSGLALDLARNLGITCATRAFGAPRSWAEAIRRRLRTFPARVPISPAGRDSRFLPLGVGAPRC